MSIDKLISGTQRDCVIEAYGEAVWSALLGESLARRNSRHGEAIEKTSQESVTPKTNSYFPRKEIRSLLDESLH